MLNYIAIFLVVGTFYYMKAPEYTEYTEPVSMYRQIFCEPETNDTIYYEPIDTIRIMKVYERIDDWIADGRKEKINQIKS